MENNKDSSDQFYLNEVVIGSSGCYHRKFCHIIKNIYSRNQKKLRNWEEAVAIGLEPCQLCKPFYPPKPKTPGKKFPMGFN